MGALEEKTPSDVLTCPTETKKVLCVLLGLGAVLVGLALAAVLLWNFCECWDMGQVEGVRRPMV